MSGWIENGLLPMFLILAATAGVIGGGLFGCFLAIRSPQARRRTFLLLLLLLLVAVIGGGLYAYKLWRDHYVWPPAVASMQDLPPLDKSGWAKPPVAWSNATETIAVATPEGLRPTPVTYFVNSIGMRLVHIGPGQFLMGEGHQASRRPDVVQTSGRPVTISRAFYLGAFEVTNRQFEQFKKHQRPKYQHSRNGDEAPIEPVTWRDAQEFCRWLSAKEGRLYRLPTEAEWEYACRAGTQMRLYWGDQFWDRNKANLGGLKFDHESWKDDGYEFTAPVGMYPPNPWALFDMIGNSWEWVSDWYGEIPDAPATDPVGPPSGHCRVHKGGGWSLRIRQANCASRDGDDPGDLPDIVSFRVLCEAECSKSPNTVAHSKRSDSPRSTVCVDIKVSFSNPRAPGATYCASRCRTPRFISNATGVRTRRTGSPHCCGAVKSSQLRSANGKTRALSSRPG
jgi:formylglycine-generating enzyme required for sulfatase activity